MASSWTARRCRGRVRRASRTFHLVVALTTCFVAALVSNPASSAVVWFGTASMSTARGGHSATLLPNGKVLVAGGTISGGGALNTTQLYDPVAGTWSGAASMSTARAHHTATLLKNGRVLVIGGTSSSPVTAEIYDPATNVWSSAGTPMPGGAWYGHTATLLANGKVLALFKDLSTDYCQPEASAKLYDPVTNSWSNAASPACSRGEHTATLLPDGTVLIAGGTCFIFCAGDVTHAERYHPTTNTWSDAGVTTIRDRATATLLANGKVLVAGGWKPSPDDELASADLYDPASNTWTSAGSMSTKREYHTATLLPNGKVLIAGGFQAYGGIGTLAAADLYDPASNTWSAEASMLSPRQGHSATLLPSGKVLVVGGGSAGSPLASAELYGDAPSTIKPAASMLQARFGHTSTMLPSGKVLVAGGFAAGSAPLASTEQYDRINDSWSPSANMATPRGYHTATLLPSGLVLVVGGRNSNSICLQNAELYDYATNTWSSGGTTNGCHSQHTATLLADGRVLVVGGSQLTQVPPSSEIYDPATNTWTNTSPMLGFDRSVHTATLLKNGKVLVTGGTNGGQVNGYANPTLATAEMYDPVADVWSSVTSMATSRYLHTATLLRNGNVLVAGGVVIDGVNAPAPTPTVEIYNPATNTWSSGASMAQGRWVHTATMLSDGEVVVAGGIGATGAELYTPSANSWVNGGNLALARWYHTATAVQAGKVLICGGDIAPAPYFTATCEMYETIVPHLSGRKPRIGGVGAVIVKAARSAKVTETRVKSPDEQKMSPTGSLSLAGTLFTGDSEASGGGTNNSATNLPVVQLRRIDNDDVAFAAPDDVTDTSYLSAPFGGLPLGHYRVTMFVNGIASDEDVVAVKLGAPVATPNLAVAISHAGSFTRGQVGASYSIVVGNAGAASTSGTVSVVDTLPAGLTATSIGGSGWNCVLATLTCTRADSLAAGASYPAIALVVNVAVDASSELVNVATVSGGGEIDVTNDTASDAAAVGQDSSANAPQAIPALDAATLVLLAAMLAFGALATLRRRASG